MEAYTRKEEEGCPRLLDLIPKDRDWSGKIAEETKNDAVSEEKKLELRLGPPGEESVWESRERKQDSLSSFGGYFAPWQQKKVFLHHLQQRIPAAAVTKEASQACSSRREGAEKKKAFSAAAPANPAVANSGGSAQKRTAPSPVVGWPPIRSFRKNIASGGTSSKPSSDPARTQNPSPKPAENASRSPFVKINMDGIPIGRKVDLKAYDSYEKLSLAVDELFRGLLAGQSESCEIGGKGIGGLLDGSGEYTLVYEDNEGDRMLVGDVPWEMFVSTVKRLRVLKSSELQTLSRAGRQEKLSVKA